MCVNHYNCYTKEIKDSEINKTNVRLSLRVSLTLVKSPYVAAFLILGAAELLVIEAMLLQAELNVSEDPGRDGGGAGEHHGPPVHPGLHTPTILS